MTDISRRDFGTIVLAGLPVAAASLPARIVAAGQLALGVTTSSFNGLPRVTGAHNVDEVMRALKAVRATHIELALANLEPAPPSVAPFMGGTPAYPRLIVLTPAEIAATNARARAQVRIWRLQTGPGFFEDVRTTLSAAGMTLHACALAFNDSFGDDEIDATFRQVRSLGAKTASSSLTMAMAARLVPFADRHQVSVAIHNQMDGNAEGAIATSDLASALRLSPRFTLKLDVGNLTASNRDAVAQLREHQTRVSHVVIKDRLRNGGASQPFGEGDTPIAGVLNVLKTSAPSVPALVEYDYIGLRSVVDEVSAALTYVEKAAK
jgi:hypothetical protein